MKTINIYGCSWSHGIPKDDLNSWVIELGKLLPEYKINNYALYGTSIAFSCWALEKTFDADAISIFQCTMPGRFSYWNDFDLSKHQVKKSNNVTCFLDKVPVTRILASQTDKQHIKFQKEYYSRLTEELELFEWKSYIDFASSRSSYIFTHRLHEINNAVSHIDNIGIILGENKYKEFVNELDGMHFGRAGQRWQAEFVFNKLKKQKIIP